MFTLSRNALRGQGISCHKFARLCLGLQADAVFLSPPWGGPSYNAQIGAFDIESAIGGMGLSYQQLLSAANSALKCPLPELPTPATAGATQADSSHARHSHKGDQCRGIACFLPKATSLEQVSAALSEGSVCEVERNVLNGRLKSVTVYHGPCAQSCVARVVHKNNT